MKNLLKKIIYPVLNLIREILIVLKKYSLPGLPQTLKTYEKHYIEENQKSYDHFKNYFKTSVLLRGHDIHKYSIKRAIENDKNLTKFYIEFGVYTGTTINFFSKFVKKIYGFDSFEGLREDWVGSNLGKGTFNLKGKLPNLNSNVFPIKGWVQDTLPQFLKEHKPSINFVHIDLDTYESSKFVLTEIKPYLSKNSIILFDELYNFVGWEVGEYKALTEAFNENEYKFLAFSRDITQATIKIL